MGNIVFDIICFLVLFVGVIIGFYVIHLAERRDAKKEIDGILYIEDEEDSDRPAMFTEFNIPAKRLLKKNKIILKVEKVDTRK